ncbi:hemerythrin family protein [Candidatus Pacearchaeota archaeon]|nr:hemerythrin family protein [Candidatus Pacearchaeota archaeon]
MDSTGRKIIIWNDDYSVGIDKVDDEHKLLINKINALYEAVNQNLTDVDILPLLDDLMDFAVYHFTEEEQLMRDAGYKDFDSHKAIHDTIVDKLKAFHRRYTVSENQRRTGFELLIFLKGWLYKHIKFADKAYAPAVTGKKQ